MLEKDSFGIPSWYVCVCVCLCLGHNLGEVGGCVPPNVKRNKKGMTKEIFDSVLSSTLRQPEWVYLFVSLNSTNLAVTVASV